MTQTWMQNADSGVEKQHEIKQNKNTDIGI